MPKKHFFLITLVLAILLTACTLPSDNTEEPTGLTKESTATSSSDTQESTVETSDAETFVPQITESSLPGLEDPWYFAWQPSEALIKQLIEYRKSNPLTEAEQSVTIQTPLFYETEREGLACRFEFFRESYTNASLFQVRITITNRRDEAVTLRYLPYHSSGLTTGTGTFPAIKDWISPEMLASYRQSTFADHLLPEILNTGESCVYESAYQFKVDPFSWEKIVGFEYVCTLDVGNSLYHITFTVPLTTVGMDAAFSSIEIPSLLCN